MSRSLGREKRLEDARTGGFIDPGAAVAHGNPGVATGEEPRGGARVGRVDLGIPRIDADLAPAGQCICAFITRLTSACSS